MCYDLRALNFSKKKSKKFFFSIFLQFCHLLWYLLNVLSHKSYQHPVEPAQYVGPVLQLCAVDHEARHHHRRRLLVEARRDVVQVHRRVAPTNIYLKL